MKAIETIYKGYRFRSRLEARWAVFFDALGVPYQYEPEGFDLGKAGYYLPDFYLPEQDRWVEIKPDSWPSHPVFDMMDEDHTLWSLVVLVGQPWLDPDAVSCHSYRGHTLCSTDSGDGPHWGYQGFISCDHPYLWCECPVCHTVGIEFDGRSARLCACLNVNKAYNTGSPRLLAAYREARQARFEHGQIGGPREWK